MKTQDSKLWDFGSVPMIEPEYLGSILASASDIALFVKLNGSILSILVNESEKSLGNLSHWEGRSIRDFLTHESIEKLNVVINKISSGQNVMHSIELNHRDNAIWQFPVRYSIHRLGSQDTVLMLGRDLRAISETQQQLVKAQIAIERGYEDSRRLDARFRMLMANTREAVLYVSTSDGKIKDANTVAAEIFGVPFEDLKNSDFSSHFNSYGQGSLLGGLVEATELGSIDDFSINLRASGQTVRLYPSIFRSSGQRYLLCRLEASELKTAEDSSLARYLLSLYQSGPDGIVFTQSNGTIEAANDGFLDLINSPSLPKIKGRSLANFLSRGQIDMAVMLDNVVRSGQVRIYATELQNEFGAKIAVEVSVAKLGSTTKPLAAFVIRDTNRAETLRKHSNESISDTNTTVAELVGSATLKEIVGETNDMIEKICIETALEMTKNNRAAAAEMLGLSRQSLYVKLRKFNLTSKDQDQQVI